MDRLRPVLEADLRIAYALVFGLRGRRAAHGGSDVDVAIGLARGARLSAREVGDLVSRLEAGEPAWLTPRSSPPRSPRSATPWPGSGRGCPPGAFEADRTAREVVILNLFVALQETVSLATHWLADAGLDVHGSYRRDLPLLQRPSA